MLNIIEKKQLPLTIVVQKLQLFLEIYKETGNALIAKKFDEEFEKTCDSYKLTREALYKTLK